MTSGLSRLLGEDDLGVGWVLGSTAQAELGVDVGSFLRSGGQAGNVIATIDAPQRQLGYDRAVGLFAPAGDRRFTTCWIELDPRVFPDGQELVGSMFDSAVEVRPFLRIDAADHASNRYRDRPSRNAWLGGAGSVAAVWTGWWWTRRREFVLYRTIHVSRAGVFLMAMTEAITISAIGATASIVVLLRAGNGGAGTEMGVWSVLASMTGGLAVSGLIALLIVNRGIASGSKDI